MENKVLLESAQQHDNDPFRIDGITHSVDGISNARPKIYRKLSTGYAPLEKGFNNSNSPKAAGFFRIMILQEKTVKSVGGYKVVSKWVLDKPMQEKLEKFCGDKEPRILPLIFFNKHPRDCSIASMVNWGANGIECESKGNGKPYRFTSYDTSGEVTYSDNGQVDVNGKPIDKCNVNNCVHRKKSKCVCKSYLEFSFFPKLPGYEPNPLEIWVYRSPSFVTLRNFSLSISKIDSLMKMAYNAEAEKVLSQEELDQKLWYFGKKFFLTHSQIKSAKGSLVWITDFVPTKGLKEELMAPVKLALAKAEQDGKARTLELQKQEKLILEGKVVVTLEDKSDLENEAENLIEDNTVDDDSDLPLIDENIITVEPEEDSKEKDKKKNDAKDSLR